MFYLKVARIFCMLKWQELVHYIKTGLLSTIAFWGILAIVICVIGGALGGIITGLHYATSYAFGVSPDSHAAEVISGITQMSLFILACTGKPIWKFLKANGVKAVAMAKETA